MSTIPGSAPLDVQRVLDALGPQRGMLYFHLLLGGLEARGDIGRQSFERLSSDEQLVRKGSASEIKNA